MQLLDCIKNDPFISAKRIADQITLSSRKVQENLKKLKSLGLLERVGNSKSGYWKVIDKA
jgi:ATP-dependent DNA helicase RecG